MLPFLRNAQEVAAVALPVEGTEAKETHKISRKSLMGLDRPKVLKDNKIPIVKLKGKK